MSKIEANLPALGVYSIGFHKESQEVLDFIGDSEFKRLDTVDHLGIAASVFTGVNHSRLEYLLLQCAVINLLPKFHKGNEHFALANPVLIPGQKIKISSGEELLKCWAILSNAGHAQYTFGVERSLLNEIRRNKAFKKIFLEDLPSTLKKEAKKIIDNYEDASFHYLLALVKITRLPKGSRLKSKLFRIMAVLMLPIEELDIKEAPDLYKIFRLKDLFSRIRLLSIVSLDAYYSHHPLRYQVSSALMNLDALLEEPGAKTEFFVLMEKTASWLADELYMHPRAAAAQKYYEVESKSKFLGAYGPRLKSKNSFIDFYPNFMNNGFGKPKLDRLFPLARLSFPYQGRGAIFGKDLYEITNKLEQQLTPDDKTHVSVLLNTYSNTLHIDLLYDNVEATTSDISVVISNTFLWLVRLIEAQVLNKVRSIRIPDEIEKEVKERLELRLRSQFTNEIVAPSVKVLKNIYKGLIKYLLPVEMVGYLSEAIPSSEIDVIGIRLQLINGEIYDTALKGLEYQIDVNPHGMDPDRLHEISFVRTFVKKSKAPYLIVCMEKFVIRDLYGNDKDDWDGVVLEVFPEQVKLSILEAKNTSPKTSRASKAFKQLEETQNIIKSKHKINSRRKRVNGLGAVITFTL